MILAVDFKVFPRRNGKIEHFGIGLMDAGAICFLSLNALLAPEVRLLKHTGPSNIASNRRKAITKSLRSTLVLLLIGLIRLFTIKKMNYQEHVSEYGVHMNFFILLALIKTIGIGLSLIFRRLIFHPLTGLLFIFLHEILLKTGFSRYIQKDEDRDSFLDKNKESFYTLIGYMGFYISCYNLVDLMVDQRSDKLKDDELNSLSNDEYRSNQIKFKFQLMFKSFNYILFYFVLSRLGDHLSEQTSRRNMNMAFTCLTLSIVCLIIFLEHFWSILSIRHYAISNSKLIIQDAYTNNGLISFLFANILTGFVNMSTNTMETDDLNAIILLFAYSFAVSISVGFLDSLNSIFN